MTSECTMVFGYRPVLFLPMHGGIQGRPPLALRKYKRFMMMRRMSEALGMGHFFFRPPQMLVDFSSMSHLIIVANQV